MNHKEQATNDIISDCRNKKIYNVMTDGQNVFDQPVKIIK